MNILIKIPEEVYNKAKETHDVMCDSVWLGIKSGVPLPKGHGRLIDADSLIKAIEEKAKRLSNADTINGLCGAVALIFDALTIIEADKRDYENDDYYKGAQEEC